MYCNLICSLFYLVIVVIPLDILDRYTRLEYSDSVVHNHVGFRCNYLLSTHAENEK